MLKMCSVCCCSETRIHSSGSVAIDSTKHVLTTGCVVAGVVNYMNIGVTVLHKSFQLQKADRFGVLVCNKNLFFPLFDASKRLFA